MKKIFAALIGIAILSSCEKDNVVDTNPSKQDSFFSKLISEEIDSDFEIFTSFSVPDPLSDTVGAPLDVRLSIQANSKNEQEVGSFTTNSTTIPFNHEIGIYDLFLHSHSGSSDFIAGNNSFRLETNGVEPIPNFTINKYSPSATRLDFTGLIDNKLPVGSGLTVNWTPDPNIPSDRVKAAILVSAQDELGENATSEYFMLNETDGQVILSAEFLSQFTGYKYFTVQYFRGYNEPVTVEDKVIDCQFLGYTYTSILWE